MCGSIYKITKTEFTSSQNSGLSIVFSHLISKWVGFLIIVILFDFITDSQTTENNPVVIFIIIKHYKASTTVTDCIILLRRDSRLIAGIYCRKQKLSFSLFIRELRKFGNPFIWGFKVFQARN